MIARRYNNEYFKITDNKKLLKIRFKNFEKIPLKYTEINRSPHYFDHKFNRDLMYKKRMRAYFGNIRIRNLKMLFIKAKKSNVNKTFSFFQTLEMRLDKFITSLKFSFSTNHAKQLIAHGKIMVNKVLITYYRHKVKKGDIVEYVYSHRLKAIDLFLLKLSNPKLSSFLKYIHFIKSRKYIFTVGLILFVHSFFF